MRKRSKPKSKLGKIWYFIWHEDSLESWIVNIILAFILIKFIVYPGLGLILSTSHPVVAVVSGSMDHGLEKRGNVYEICGNIYPEYAFKRNFDNWWDNCGEWYVERDIYKEEFKSFPMSNGFSKGDIIVLRGKNNLEIGDIIVFHGGQNYPIIHRIVEINGDLYTTKGDHNKIVAELDQNINQERIIGSAYFKIPYLGYIKILAVDLLNVFI